MSDWRWWTAMAFCASVVLGSIVFIATLLSISLLGWRCYVGQPSPAGSPNASWSSKAARERVAPAGCP
jgi:hypothetical protein